MSRCSRAPTAAPERRQDVYAHSLCPTRSWSCRFHEVISSRIAASPQGWEVTAQRNYLFGTNPESKSWVLRVWVTCTTKKKGRKFGLKLP